MKKLLCCAAVVIFTAAVGAGAAAQSSSSALLKQTRRQQKIERKRLKVQEKIWKRSFRGQPIPRAERIEEEHQLQRNMRDLKMRQKDELQAMKDQQRVAKYRSAHPLY